tara:strand:- start:3274 stop:3636 length:363 start_codon:yes stop_codon:yes gene_type:complete
VKRNFRRTWSNVKEAAFDIKILESLGDSFIQLQCVPDVSMVPDCGFSLNDAGLVLSRDVLNRGNDLIITCRIRATGVSADIEIPSRLAPFLFDNVNGRPQSPAWMALSDRDRATLTGLSL